MKDLDKKADIVAVAKAARVSPSTVSRSFNHPELVKATTRKRIDRAVRKLGYIRNRAAQTIHGIRSATIGLVVPTVDQTIFAELIQSFSDSVEEMGFTILLASHGYDLGREYALTRKMLEHRVDGVALIGLDHAEDTYKLLAQQNTPALLLWNYAADAPLPCVGTDNFRAGQLIGAHVAGLGHRRIATIFPPVHENDRAAHRLAGILDALHREDRAVPEGWHHATPYDVAAAKRSAVELMRAATPPTAIICGNDVLAWGALHALAAQGIRVPRDVTVTGIGDFRGSGDFEPALTTVRIPAGAIGMRAARSIVALITAEGSAPVQFELEPELVIRATSAPAPA
ncbi:substrate-binding domain-containing protein [Cribrihabitans sp. XS_ASV171]